MNLTKKYMMFWCAIILAAVLADVFDVFATLEIDGNSFVYGLLIGFVIMKFAPTVRDSEDKEEN